MKMRVDIIMTMVALLLFVILIETCRRGAMDRAEGSRKEEIMEHNLKAMYDTIVVQKNKNGDMEAVVHSYIARAEDLGKYNVSLYNELQKERGKSKAIAQMSVGVNTGAVSMQNVVSMTGDSLYTLSFDKEHSDSTVQWKISGYSKFKMHEGQVIPDVTNITTNSTKVRIVMGFREEKGEYVVYARSNNPNVSFTDLDGALLIPKKPDVLCPTNPIPKKFGIGLVAGYGVTSTGLSPFVGVGCSWTLIRF